MITATVETAMRVMFSIPQIKVVRLWEECVSDTYKHLDKPLLEIQEAGIYEGQSIYIEVKKDDWT